AGVPEAQLAAHGELHVIPALELSTYDAGAEYHVLGYYVDPEDPRLLAHGARASSAREVRMRGMIERLGALGIHLDFEHVVAAAGATPESIGRPHLARALLERGHVSTIAEAFDRFIGDHGPAFVPTALITPFDAIDI